MHAYTQTINLVRTSLHQRSIVTSVAFGAHPTSDASQIALKRAFAPVYRPLGAVFSVFVRPESLNPGFTPHSWPRPNPSSAAALCTTWKPSAPIGLTPLYSNPIKPRTTAASAFIPPNSPSSPSWTRSSIPTPPVAVRSTRSCPTTTACPVIRTSIRTPAPTAKPVPAGPAMS